MKILFLGEIGEGQTSLMRMKALVRLGHVVRGVHTIEPWRSSRWLNRQIQRRRGKGSIVRRINESILDAAREFRPDLVWAEKQEFLGLETISSLRGMGARLVHFTPDPYFSLAWKRTATMDRAMREFDALVFCKAYERDHYEALGNPSIYMPLGYCDEVHRPLPSRDPQWRSAVGFLGGWEPRREHLLRQVLLAGLDLKVRGGYWQFLVDGRWTLRRYVILKQLAGADRFRIRRDDLLAEVWKGDEVYADDYARALTGADIGLGLLRKICPDQHTTRTFEIPACGSMLLADRTDEHREFFEEGREADYFGSAGEMIDKLKFYARNDSARRSIASAGRARCVSAGYSYVNRLRKTLTQLQTI